MFGFRLINDVQIGIILRIRFCYNLLNQADRGGAKTVLRKEKGDEDNGKRSAF